MATKKQKSTKTASRKTTAAKTHKKACNRTCCKKCCKGISNTERMHVFIVTGLSIAAGILLCADVAMIAVQ